jgi:hypothetical protein
MNMAYEQRDNSGSLFNNDRKESEKHPDRTGKAMIGGVMYWVSGWIKEGTKGKFMSLAFKPMEEHGQEDQTRQQNKPQGKPQGGGKPQQQQLGEEEVPW